MLRSSAYLAPTKSRLVLGCERLHALISMEIARSAAPRAADAPRFFPCAHAILGESSRRRTLSSSA